ncbi:SAM-dependent methyltransferase [Streptomyces diacarni]|uniref:SAM-dependent methyltransferase n=1 Tax=Streptomyces diacarni TaxID=2800381 RepID=UPI0033D23676
MSEHSSPSSGAGGQATTVAHNARVWNYWLGGKNYHPVDKEIGDHVLSMFPTLAEAARADRAFLRRAVTHLTETAGIRQFLDIGAGLPTVDNTHEVAQRSAPESRIVYVDNDPTVLVHARALLTGSPEGATDYIEADAHQPETILQRAARTLDFDRPVAVMMLGVLNFVLDTDTAKNIVRRIMDAVPSGSHLVLTHPTLEIGGEGGAAMMRFWNENATPPITDRDSAQIADFFEGLQMLEPGIVPCSQWRAEQPADLSQREVAEFGAVGRKR